MTETDQTDLERMIDLYGLSTVINGMVDICYAKEEHITVNWQDRTTARQWLQVARLLSKTATEITL